MSIIETDKQYVAGTYNRFPVELVSGKGNIMTDVNGKEYIDLTSGIGVTAFGIDDEEWKQAVIAQLGKVQHTSNLFYTEPCAQLAKRICERTGMSKVFFANSGAESNECAIKAARKYAADKYGADRYTIVTLQNSFHGRTLTTLAATGQDHYHELFQPLTPGFVSVPAGDFDAFLEVAKTTKIAGIMMEIVQGEGGVMPVDPDYVRAVCDYAHENDIIFIVDEVQTGNGRSGMLYAYMTLGIKPDVFTTAKGLGGGLPIGACVLGEKVQNVLGFGDHGSTYGGNPAACAGAISVYDRLTDDFMKEVQEKSAYVFKACEGAKGVESVSGLGLMIGIKTTKPAGEVVKKCIEKGVLALTAKDRVRLLPALNISMEDLKKAVEIILETAAE